MSAKDPASSRDLWGLEGAKSDVCPNAIELGLAAKGKKIIIGIETQVDGEKVGGRHPWSDGDHQSRSLTGRGIHPEWSPS